MRDSLSLALSDGLVVAPLMHVVHLHAQRSTNPSGTFFYHYQGQIGTIQPVLHDQQQDIDQSEYHVRFSNDFIVCFFQVWLFIVLRIYDIGPNGVYKCMCYRVK